MSTLSDITEIIVDSEHKTAPIVETGYPYIRTPNIGRGNLLLDKVRRVSEESYNQWTRRAVPQKDDLILAREAPIGNVAIIPDRLRVCLGQRTVLIRPRKDIVNPRFLLYLLLSQEIQAIFQAYSSGATVPHLNLRDIRSLELKIPEKKIQDKIAHILGSYDELIGVNENRVRLLEKVATCLYNEWFVNLKYPNYIKDEIIETEYGPTPKGWKRYTLSELVNTQYGYTKSATNEPVGPKYLRGKDINKTTYIDWETVPFCPIEQDLIPKYQLKKNDVLIIRMADPGKVGIIESEVNAVFASYLIRLSITNHSLTPYYLYYYLMSDAYQNYISGASTGTTRKSASAKVVTTVSILVPPNEIMKKFETIISSLRSLLVNLLEINKNALQSRDILLSRLLSGEIDVSKLDIVT
jgi:type I restriction enzyme, S subunit